MRLEKKPFQRTRENSAHDSWPVPPSQAGKSQSSEYWGEKLKHLGSEMGNNYRPKLVTSNKS